MLLYAFFNDFTPMKHVFVLLILLILCSSKSFSQTKEEIVTAINGMFESYKDSAVDPYQLIIDNIDGVEFITVKLRAEGRTLFSYSFTGNDVSSILTYKAPAGNTNIKIYSSNVGIMKVNYNDPDNSADWVDTVNIVLEGPAEEIERLKARLMNLVTAMGGDFG